MTKQTTIVVIGALRVKCHSGLKRPGGGVVGAFDFGSRGFMFDSRWRWNSTHDCMAR